MKQFFLREIAHVKAFVNSKYDKFIDARNRSANWAMNKILDIEPTSDTETYFMIPVAAFFFALAIAINFSR